jgi:shikimate dehydrogenase
MASQKVGLIGHPVGHSVSPRFQQAAFDALGLDARYEAWDTLDCELDQRIAGLRNPDMLGANVTLPHKQRALELADEASAEALLAGVANTLVNRDGRLCAHNTDVGGFLRALREEARFDPAGKRAVLLGAGGAARAVAVALMQQRVASITVLNRSPGRAERLIEDLRPHTSAALRAGSLDSAAAAIAGCELLVHCTSLGLAATANADRTAVPEAALHAGLLVVDIVANPIWTPLLQRARARGCVTLGGLAMLVSQGALAFELWTGREAPLPVMLSAARAAMGLEA